LSFTLGARSGKKKTKLALARKLAVTLIPRIKILVNKSDIRLA
jgi:hypothetical protein